MTVRILIGLLVGAGIGAALGYYGQCSSGTCPLTSTPWRGALYGAVMGLLFAFSFARPGPSDDADGASATENKHIQEETH